MSLGAARAALVELAAQAGPSDGRVHLTTRGDVAWIRLDHPSVRNALTVGMMLELADAVEALAAFPGWGLVVASQHPGMYCSGGHLDQVQRALLDPALGATMAAAMAVVLDALRDLPMISVAAIEGPAVGGGAELTTACDFRVMRRGASIHFAQARLGVAAGWGGASRLVALAGRRVALGVLARAERIGADEALALGLADRIGDEPADVLAEAFLDGFAGVPAAALRGAKCQVVGATDPDVQVRAFAALWGGPAHRAALAARGARGPS